MRTSLEERRVVGAAQRERALRTRMLMRGTLRELWNLDTLEPDAALDLDASGPRIEALLARVAERLGADADQAIVDFFGLPSLRGVENESVKRAWDISRIEMCACEAWIVRQGSSYASEQLCERARHLMRVDGDGASENFNLKLGYAAPTLIQVFALLDQLAMTPQALTLMEDVLSGALDVPLAEASSEGLSEGRVPARRLYEAYGSVLRDAGRVFLRRLTALGRLDYARYRQAVACIGSALVEPELLQPSLALDDVERALAAHTETLVEEWIDALPETALRFHDAFSREPRYGAAWLLRGLSTIERLKLSGDQVNKDRGYEGGALARQEVALAQALELLLNVDGLDPAQLALLEAELGRFRRETLELSLPYARAARRSLLRALGWESLIPLEAAIEAIAGGNPNKPWLVDLDNNDDPESGLIDREALHEVVAHVPQDALDRYVSIMAASRRRIANTLKYVTAVRGHDRKALEKSVNKHAQVAIKAYGLLPALDEDEVLARFMTFKRIAKEASRYGPERTRNILAAVQVGLAHLAQAAGYPDVGRLEWTMEARLAEEASELDGTHRIEAWEVHVSIEGDEPALRVTKAGKALKTVPSAVRKSELYLRFKEREALIKAQARRSRQAFEAMMCTGELLRVDDLRALLKLSVARALIARLVLCSEHGAYGFLQDDLTLRDVAGQSQPLGSHVRVAHPVHMFEAGALSALQRAVVEARLVQPFKQVFRELYLLTPAERDTATFSNRFAQHAIRGAIAGKLLAARGWTIESGGGVSVTKKLRANGLRAELGFERVGHYFSELQVNITGPVRFSAQAAVVSLEHVPAQVFSEVMRDVDLVVSVAHAGGESQPWSSSTVEHRAALVGAITGELGLTGVRIEAPFVHVRGKRGSYRVHLGSGAVHLEPSQHLCIIPVPDAQERIFLPFAEPDLATSAIVSKVLLLVADDKISDPSILAQLEGR